MTFSKLAAITALAATIAMSPSVSFAKENGKGNDRGADKVLQKESCFHAYGHLIAPGWIKLNGAVTAADMSGRCHIPNGIANKFQNEDRTHDDRDNENRNNEDRDAHDTLAPVISAIVTQTTGSAAEIRWSTNERSDAKIFVSTSTPASKTASTTRIAVRNEMTKNHDVTISNLSASTTYYALIEVRDNAGNATTSGQFSFTTQASSTVSDTRAPVMTSLYATVASTSAKVFWNTNEAATTRVYFSATNPVNVNSTSTARVDNASLVTNHEIALSGLSTSTKYYMVAESKDAAGNTRTTTQFSITTALGL